MNPTVISFIQQQTAASIFCATDKTEPYSFSCFYVFNPQKMHLYFKSSPNTHHAQVLEENPHISGTILPDQLDKKAVKGVQFTGKILLSGSDLTAEAHELYHRQIPQAHKLEGRMYVLELETLKMTENIQGIFEKTRWQRKLK